LGNLADVTLVTFSKAMGLAGGALCGSAAFCESVANFGRAYIYSTSIAPAIAAGVCEAIEVMRDEPQRQTRLRDLSSRARARAGMAGDSPIIPIELGSESAALEAAERLEEAGFVVVPIRPPTVAPGTSRLRITMSCDHSEADVDRLVDAVAQH
jgi:8-amino-7-oxononanoate synthase